VATESERARGEDVAKRYIAGGGALPVTSSVGWWNQGSVLALTFDRRRGFPRQKFPTFQAFFPSSVPTKSRSVNIFRR
jgi:hypothetical protein